MENSTAPSARSASRASRSAAVPSSSSSSGACRQAMRNFMMQAEVVTRRAPPCNFLHNSLCAQCGGVRMRAYVIRRLSGKTCQPG
eukprot:1158555-Pelagomonas_calceolata.AAC.4